MGMGILQTYTHETNDNIDKHDYDNYVSENKTSYSIYSLVVVLTVNHSRCHPHHRHRGGAIAGGTDTLWHRGD